MSGARAYYNEIDPYAAQWLRNLIDEGLVAKGDVDERSVVDVRPVDLAGYAQCHFFAGIGGWSLAMRLAGWPDERLAWTGSCPCQPFSSAARGRIRGVDDKRHLWPVWYRLIAECRPPVVFGEQVARARAWLDGVCDDMEAADYTIWAGVLPAWLVGADHARERIYFAGHTDRHREPGLSVHAEVGGMSRCGREPGGMGQANGVPPRMAVLRAFGNAIHVKLASNLISAFMECMP